MRLTILALWCALALSAQMKAPTDEASLREGLKLYQFHCSFCHGKGDDGMAANLVTPNLVHAPTDASLVNIIRNGIGGTDMPPALGMSEQEMLMVAGYVRSLGRTAPTSIAGDAAKGKALYLGKGGCAGCHMVDGKGGRSGPDLTLIGAMRSPGNLRTSIVDPNASMVGGWSMVHLTLKSGQKVSGIRLNEDNFHVSLRDGKGKIQTIAKAEAVKIDRDLTRSSMPAYGKVFSEDEMTDLIAYLFSLRGAL
ncbi:MAG: c-type cytochrome [Bryobacter sp.]|jgi:cytochrome c oxidase cbb3-type subunit 3|nr:c-type cytochrome [Bryobacter sp. CoA8 C33]